MRLIDADKLKEYMKEWDFIGLSCALEAVDDMPTIPQTAIKHFRTIECPNCTTFIYDKAEQTTLSEADFIELRHRYGENVEKTVRRMCGK